jgi:hypothetical protein
MSERGDNGWHGRLVREDPAWLYQGWHGSLAARRLQVWQTGPGQLVAIVTEQPDDVGTSITNATEAVIAQLTAEYPDSHVQVIEHYTPRSAARGAHAYQRWTLTSDSGRTVEFPPAAETVDAGSWDLVSLDPRGSATWQTLTPAGVARILYLAPGDAGKVCA